jgi:two-component system sensor histidine kinase GlrK
MWRLTIFQRLSLGYLAILIVVICLGGYSVWRLSQLDQIAKSLSSVDSVIIRTANNAKDNLITQAAYEQKFVVSGDQDFYQQFKLAGEFLNKKINLMDKILADQKKKGLIISLKENYKIYLDEAEEEFQFLKNKEAYDYQALQTRKATLVNELISNLENIIRLAREDMQKKIQTANTIGDQAVKFTIIATFLAIALALVIAFFNARTINHPVVSLMKRTKRIAQGDFDTPLNIASPPEIRALAESFNTMCARLQELDQMKADFIAHVSHELRTPLTSIREATNLLQAGKLGKPSVTQSNLLKIIQEECERLINSVSSILELSRLESGMTDFQMEKYSLSPLLKKNIARLHPIAKQKEIDLRLKLPSDLPLVLVDWEKFDQVVVNLLGNALKFTPPGGRITVSASRKKIPAAGSVGKNAQEIIEVCISDTGCGIAQDDLDNIFEKFRKIKGKGSGLGLAIARHITIAHGGEIWVKSRPDKGSAFFFTLPAAC